MGRKEHPLVWYCHDDRNFAELMDGWLFHGKGCIRAEDIRSADRRFLVKSGKQAYRDRYRDIFKSADGMGLRLFIGTEHQAHVHYAMPVRIMDYDSASYSLQKDMIRRQHEAAHDLAGDERLSGFSGTDRLTPVITLVLYCGSRPWDGASRLHQILDLEHIPQQLRQYIADYRIHVLDVCHTSDRRLKEFPPDIRTLFLFLKYRDNPEKLKSCMAREQDIRSDTYNTIAESVGERRLKTVRPEDKGGKINMCKAIDILIADGEKRGLARGIAQERKNTKRAEQRARREQERARREQERATKAEKRIKELEQMLNLQTDNLFPPKDTLEK